MVAPIRALEAGVARIGAGALGHRIDVRTGDELEALAEEFNRMTDRLRRFTEDLQRSRERLVVAREEERRRIRRDLHDGLGPMLASLTLKLDVASDMVGDKPAARALLRDLKDQTQTAITDIRGLVYALRPPALDDLGLVAALREEAEQYGLSGLDVSFDAPQTLPPLPAAVEVAIYRIAQEALTNVARHANARQCTVRLILSNDLAELEVSDDGQGLAPSSGRGVGLGSMRERAEELGGTCFVESPPAGGTRLRATVPLTLGATLHNESPEAAHTDSALVASA
jgi:signal transduction histidine kinase